MPSQFWTGWFTILRSITRQSRASCYALRAMTAPGYAANPTPPGDELLAQPLQFLKGVGPMRAEILKRLALETVADLLYFFPVAHKDRAHVTPVARLRLGQDANIRAQIIDMNGHTTYNGRQRVTALLQDESGQIRAVWWNPYVADKLPPLAWGFFSGKVVANKAGGRELSGPDFELLTSGEPEDEEAVADPVSPSFGRIVPIYSLRPKQRRPDGSEPHEIKLTQAALRKVVWRALQDGAPARLRDDLPEALRQRRNLLPIAEAIRQFHFPESLERVEQARRRLAYEELFVLSMGVGLRRAQVARLRTARKLPLTPAIQSRIEARLPFQLTPAQTRAFREIAADLAGERPMNRLLQGDVGCGKTAVAASAMLLTVAHGGQAALLAPTEVLAEQHLRTFSALLDGSRVKIGLLRGGAGEAQRGEFREGLESGQIHLAIGTHALLQPDIHFKDLALVVVDEQHKFGVQQRQALREKGRAPHVLVMTATPIPRSLSLTLYGDLDLSLIDALPPGRGEVVTKGLKETERAKTYQLILKEAQAGHAAYVVLPRIEEEASGSSANEPNPLPPSLAGKGSTEETPKSKLKIQNSKLLQPRLWTEVKGVGEEVRRLKEQLPTLRIGALHGRMAGAEKDRVLEELREGKLDVLVSTQVIEVGIDLPRATVMLIENAERFGLSNLHQLRGRVGRSGLKSYCLYFGHPNTPEGKERLKAFAALGDGFQIAEADFRLRGPGHFFGTEQSGLPELLVADLLRDQRLLQDAREDAFEVVRADPELEAPALAGVRRRVREVFAQGERLGLVDVG